MTVNQESEKILTPEEMDELDKKLSKMSDEEVDLVLDNWLKSIPSDAVEIIPPDLSNREVLGYLYYIQACQIKTSDRIASVSIKVLPDGNCSLDYTMQPPKFQRIRRITGYLVGTLDRFNNAKRQEAEQRVKHTGKDGWSFNH